MKHLHCLACNERFCVFFNEKRSGQHSSTKLSRRQQNSDFDADLAFVDDDQDAGTGADSILVPEESQPSAKTRGMNIIGRADVYTDALDESSGGKLHLPSTNRK